MSLPHDSPVRDALGEKPDSSFVTSKSCQGYAETFCNAFAQCASSRGVPGLFMLRYGTMQSCVAGTSMLCAVDFDVFVSKTQRTRLSDPWACRAAHVSSCEDVLGLAAPAASCHLTPGCVVDGGVGYVPSGGRCGLCSPFPSGISCDHDSASCSDYGYGCRPAMGGGGGAECRKIELGGEGSACAPGTDHDCLPSFACQDNVCRPKAGPGAICGDKILCNDQLGLECLPDATVTGGKSCQIPHVVPDGLACGGTPRGRCSDFSYCDGSTCVLRRIAGACDDGANGPACLPGALCLTGFCRTDTFMFCE